MDLLFKDSPCHSQLLNHAHLCARGMGMHLAVQAMEREGGVGGGGKGTDKAQTSHNLPHEIPGVSLIRSLGLQVPHPA